MNKRTNQGGSVVVFIFIAILLVVGLAVSVYYVKQRGDTARRDQAIAANNEKQAEKSSNQSTNSETDENNQSNNNEEIIFPSEQSLPQGGVSDVVYGTVAIFAIFGSIFLYISSLRESKAFSL